MKKKILMVLFLMTVMSINATAVSTASPDVFSGDVSPKCTICKSCGEEAVQKEAVRYGEWSYTGDVSCVHEGGGDWYQDEKQVRLVFYPAVCKKCGISDTECKVEECFIHIGDRKKIQYIL